MFYVDKNIINNSVLACFLLTNFIAEFEKDTQNKRNTDISLLLLVLPLLWHETSRIAIRNKKKVLF
ncbi:three component ABC system middle component [Pantoea dispersa]|uniref:three component ABC system middle component n=1 Tax=Pantoea dispersa TaxID=59814 RepID=UPI0030B8BD59